MPVVQIIMKYGFNILKNMKVGGNQEDSDDGEPDLKESFLMELFEKGKMTMKLFKLIAPLLKQQTLATIKNFKADLRSQGV